MINEVAGNVLRFLVLMTLQILLLNNIQFSGYINPMLYTMFILMLPIETATWMVICIGFVTGIVMDTFCNSAGLHAAATTLMAYSRSYILKLFAPRDGYEFGMKPTLYSLGTAWFAYYAAILIFIHHFALFYLESFRFSEFFFTFGKVLVSGFFTLVLIIISQLLIYKPKAGYSG